MALQYKSACHDGLGCGLGAYSALYWPSGGGKLPPESGLGTHAFGDASCQEGRLYANYSTHVGVLSQGAASTVRLARSLRWAPCLVQPHETIKVKVGIRAKANVEPPEEAIASRIPARLDSECLLFTRWRIVGPSGAKLDPPSI